MLLLQQLWEEGLQAMVRIGAWGEVTWCCDDEKEQVDCNYVVLLVRTSRLHFQISRASEFVCHIALGGGLLGQRDGCSNDQTVTHATEAIRWFEGTAILQWSVWMAEIIDHAFSGLLMVRSLISCWIVTLAPLKECPGRCCQLQCSHQCLRKGWVVTSFLDEIGWTFGYSAGKSGNIYLQRWREAADMANDNAWRSRGEGKRFRPSSTASLNQPNMHLQIPCHAMPMIHRNMKLNDKLWILLCCICIRGAMANGVATLCRDASATLASNCTFAASMHDRCWWDCWGLKELRHGHRRTEALWRMMIDLTN